MTATARPPALGAATPPKPFSVAEQWDTRLGFYWYGDREIFGGSDAPLREQAERLAAAGINHAITFTPTHFRWSFRRWWPLLNETLARVVTACHACGIRVTEHHSAHLTFNPIDEAGERFLVNVLRTDTSAIESWPGLRADCDADPVVWEDVRLSALRQIDGRTGKWARSSYQGWCLCFNQPVYRAAYLAYLETVYATGVDGIMTDDVQWFGATHACACGRCRELFGQRTGHELPAPGEPWQRWHGRFEEPGYRGWLDFKLRSNEEFHRAVKDHYERLGRRLLRPNYVSGILAHNWTGYTLETLPALDWVFQESCQNAIARYSWPSWMFQAYAFFSLGRRREIPAQNMFYPNRPDLERFCWALAMSWGLGYLATAEGGYVPREEAALRAFERAHQARLRRPRKFARLALYDSRRYRELDPRSNQAGLARLRFWLTACGLRNLPADLLETGDLDRLARYDVVTVTEIALLSDAELAAFRTFLDQGGTLVWLEGSGAYDENGVPRPPAELWRQLGGSSVATDGTTVAVGQGRLVPIPRTFAMGNPPQDYWSDRYAAVPPTVPYQPLSAADHHAQGEVVSLLSELLPHGSGLQTENLPDGVLATVFATEDGQALVVHLVNAAGTLDATPGQLVGHGDPIPFPSHAGKPAISLRVSRPPDRDEHRWSAPVARLFTLEGPPDGVTLSCHSGKTGVSVRLDPAHLTQYALVEIRPAPQATAG